MEGAQLPFTITISRARLDLQNRSPFEFSMTPLTNSARKIQGVARVLLWVICGLILAAGLLLLVVPNLDGPHSRLFANEASAVGKLRTIVQLQNEYTARRENRGFACNLPPLKSIGQQ